MRLKRLFLGVMLLVGITVQERQMLLRKTSLPLFP